MFPQLHTSQMFPPAACQQRSDAADLGDALLVLDLHLNIVNCVRRLHLQGDGLADEGLDKDLHTTMQAEHQVKGQLLLDVIISKGTTILELLASKDETLLVRGGCPPCPESWPSHCQSCLRTHSLFACS